MLMTRNERKCFHFYTKMVGGMIRSSNYFTKHNTCKYKKKIALKNWTHVKKKKTKYRGKKILSEITLNNIP